MRTICIVAILSLAGLSCEDGPDQIFHKNDGNVPEQNGYSPAAPFAEPGGKGFDEVGGDAGGRAKFCDVAEQEALVQQMAVAPIIPDTSVGTVPLWAQDGTPTFADDLVGRPEDGKFCDPDQEYADAYVWGPQMEIIVLFDMETRLVEAILAYYDYSGVLEGSFTNDSSEQETITVKTKRYLTFNLGDATNERKLKFYTKTHANSWLNPVNINAIYKMLRETFFGDAPADLQYDCVDKQICDIIYTATDIARPQTTVLAFRDSGIFIVFNPDGSVPYVEVDPVRIQQFEVDAQISFDGTPVGDNGGSMAMQFNSLQVPACSFALEDDLTWSQFKTLCSLTDDMLPRLNYNVEDERDAVNVGLNSMTLTFQRDITVDPVLLDGERPGDNDLLRRIGFSRNLPAKVEEFVPQTLATDYLQKLEARFVAAVYDPDGPGGLDPTGHPFLTPSDDPDDILPAAVPASLSADDERIGELFYQKAATPVQFLIDDGTYCTNATDDALSRILPLPANSTIIEGSIEIRLNGDGTVGSGTLVANDPEGDGVINEVLFNNIEGTIDYESGLLELTEAGTDVWSDGDTVSADFQTQEKRSYIPDLIDRIDEHYLALSLDEKLMLNAPVNDSLYIIEAFVDTVMEAFSYQMSDTTLNPDTFKVFTTTDDRRWSIGDAHFFLNTNPYRLDVQYSLNYGAVTWVSLSMGYNKIDELFANLNTACQTELNPADPDPYYGLALSQQPEELSFQNPYAVNGTGISVTGYSRELETLDVVLQSIETNGDAGTPVTITVSGAPIEDNTGYYRQLKGERWEFIPADRVDLYGKEYAMSFYVGADGRIGRVVQSLFRNALTLCEGFADTESDLEIVYGDDVRAAIMAWQDTVSTNTFRQCELVYNYTENANILDSIASIENRVQIYVMDERAIGAAIWK